MARRRDSRRQFAIATITRAQIAAEISTVCATDVAPNKLSDSLCTRYAKEYGYIQECAANGDTDEDGREEAEVDLNVRYGREIGVLSEEWAGAADE